MSLQVREGDAVPRHHGHLAAAQEVHLPRVLQDGRHVGGQEHLVVALAHHQAAGVAEPGGDEAVRLPQGHNDDRVGALDAGQGAARGLGQVARRLIGSYSCSMRWTSTSVSVSDAKTWPSDQQLALSGR